MMDSFSDESDLFLSEEGEDTDSDYEPSTESDDGDEDTLPPPCTPRKKLSHTSPRCTPSKKAPPAQPQKSTPKRRRTVSAFDSADKGDDGDEDTLPPPRTPRKKLSHTSPRCTPSKKTPPAQPRKSTPKRRRTVSAFDSADKGDDGDEDTLPPPCTPRKKLSHASPRCTPSKKAPPAQPRKSTLKRRRTVSAFDSADKGDDGDEDTLPPPRTPRKKPSHTSPRCTPSKKAPPPQPQKSTPKRRRTVSASDSGDRWHNKEDEDTAPTPLRFVPVRAPGPTLDTSTRWTVLQLFQLFFSTSVVRTIIENTNTNAARRKLSTVKYKWKPLTVKDFYTFLAIIVYTGLVSVHHRSDYWRKVFPYNHPFPGNTMARDRFESIIWSLHLSDPTADEDNEQKKKTPGYDRLFKINPLYSDIVTACKAHFQPYQNICIDERMVASKARIKMKQYHKDKPTKWGYKLFVLADSSTGYTWNFFVYTGKSMTFGEFGLSYSSVIDLMPFSLLGRGYKLYLDNFYTSPLLLRDLLSKGIGSCGTIQRNCTGFPKSTENDLPRNATIGDMRWMRKDGLLFLKWRDKREVAMCSSVHRAYSGQSLTRRVKTQDEWKDTQVPCPDAVVDYNKNMGGVDLSDALIGFYSVLHKTMKWYKTFFYHFLDIAVVNSHILHKELVKKKDDGTKPLTQKEFREQLCKEMMTFAMGSEQEQPEAVPATCMAMYYSDDATKGRKYCRRCQDTGDKRVKTPIYCRKCQVPLCLTSKKNCFEEWHDKHRKI